MGTLALSSCSSVASHLSLGGSASHRDAAQIHELKDRFAGYSADYDPADNTIDLAALAETSSLERWSVWRPAGLKASSRTQSRTPDT
jgi:hypothetical protein